MQLSLVSNLHFSFLHELVLPGSTAGTSTRRTENRVASKLAILTCLRVDNPTNTGEVHAGAAHDPLRPQPRSRCED